MPLIWCRQRRTLSEASLAWIIEQGAISRLIVVEFAFKSFGCAPGKPQIIYRQQFFTYSLLLRKKE